MDFHFENNTLTVLLSGRIDSTNAETVGAEVEKICAEHPTENLIFDADELEYISSAGLRMTLKYRKLYPSLRIVNANSEVYDVFEMTGFTEMIPVEKAYRKLSVDGCDVIGRGANGTVYRLNPEIIIKVYNDNNALADVQNERELAKKAFILGIPTAIPFDIVKVGDKFGSVFELLNATSFAKLFKTDSDNADRYIDLYVDLLKKIHSTEVKPGDMPPMKVTAQKWAKFVSEQLPPELGNKLVALVDAVPDTNRMMHGDYHIKNVMMQNGEVLLIDMDTLCLGDPVFEFASIFMAYKGFSSIDKTAVERFLDIPYEMADRIWNETLVRYFGTTDPAVLDNYAARAKIICYTRLLRRTLRRPDEANTEDGKKLIDFCRAQLTELIPKVDSLSFSR